MCTFAIEQIIDINQIIVLLLEIKILRNLNFSEVKLSQQICLPLNYPPPPPNNSSLDSLTDSEVQGLYRAQGWDTQDLLSRSSSPPDFVTPGKSTLPLKWSC